MKNLKKTQSLNQKWQHVLILVLVICLFLSCNNSKSNAVVVNNDNIPVYNFDQLQPLLHTDSNKTYIVNFWAMWCAPCVKELPYIQDYQQKHPETEVILVSLDFVKDIETKLKPFLKQNNITSKVVLLDDPASNIWIDKIDPNWSGAIPFTIVFNNNKRAFFERSFESVEDLEIEINKTLTN
mgnify:FL=1